MILEPKPGITYGPVNSRRLGASLGINLFPGAVKVCPFNCVYCQYGWTTERRVVAAARRSLPSADAVAKAVEETLRGLPSPPSFLTFSGNGEPTLHPDFPEIVEAVRRVRDEWAPGARTAILSNSTLAGEEETRRALARLDARIMKLDCGTEVVFRLFNGPEEDCGLEAVTEGLAELALEAPITIQSLWAGGTAGNLPEPSERRTEEVEAWVGRLKRIKPEFVQVYSLDRDTPAKNLRKLSRDELSFLASRARHAGIPASVFTR